MLQEAQNTGIEDVMTGRGDKRRDEGVNPKPAQPKARTASWTQDGARWTKDEPIPKAPPPKASPKSPEAEHEPRGPRGRPKSTPASSSTETPFAKAKAKAEARQTNPEETRSKAKPVKKNVKQKPVHDTDLVTLDNFNEWNARGRGFLVDQIRKRPGIKFTNTDAKKMKKADMIEKLSRFDGKI
jgi:type IV secretory pathway VirB10-like protein